MALRYLSSHLNLFQAVIICLTLYHVSNFGGKKKLYSSSVFGIGGKKKEW